MDTASAAAIDGKTAQMQTLASTTIARGDLIVALLAHLVDQSHNVPVDRFTPARGPDGFPMLADAVKGGQLTPERGSGIPVPAIQLLLNDLSQCF
jgi:hypothetical protein